MIAGAMRAGARVLEVLFDWATRVGAVCPTVLATGSPFVGGKGSALPHDWFDICQSNMGYTKLQAGPACVPPQSHKDEAVVTTQRQAHGLMASLWATQRQEWKSQWRMSACLLHVQEPDPGGGLLISSRRTVWACGSGNHTQQAHGAPSKAYHQCTVGQQGGR
jgi:hypothetical protein